MMTSFMFIATFIIWYLFLIFLLIKNQELQLNSKHNFKSSILIRFCNMLTTMNFKIFETKKSKICQTLCNIVRIFNFSWFLIILCRFHWSFKLKQLLVDKIISTSISVLAKTISCRKTFFTVALILIQNSVLSSRI